MEYRRENALAIIWADIKEIKPYPQNAKMHSETQIKNVAESIKQFGWKQPIVCDKDGVIIVGHCRYEAAKQLDLEQVPVLYATDLTSEQVRKYRVLDNKTNESGWDIPMLTDDLDGLDFDGFDIDWGIDIEEGKEIERKEAPFDESISVVISCANENEAEEIFNRLSGEGYDCRISTL